MFTFFFFFFNSFFFFFFFLRNVSHLISSNKSLILFHIADENLNLVVSACFICSLFLREKKQRNISQVQN